MKKSHWQFSMGLTGVVFGAVCLYWAVANHVEREVVAAVDNQSAPDPEVRIVVARRELFAGEPVSEDMLALRSFPASLAPTRGLDISALEFALGKSLRNDIEAGQPVRPQDIAEDRAVPLSDRVPSGWRAVTIGVNELSSLAYRVVPGDRVDVYRATYAAEHAGMVPIAKSVQVLAVGEAEHREDVTPGYDTMTLLAPEKTAAALIAAGASGAVTVTLCSRRDSAAATAQPAPTTPVVEWITGAGGLK